jgi:enoyl-[acyl-carrier protein] reductase II
MERSGASIEELDQLGAGKLRAAVRDGDTVTGSVMIGQVAGMVTCVKPVAQIIEEIMNEIPTVMMRVKQSLN